MFFRYWRRKLLLISVLFILIIVLYYNQKRFIDKNLINEESHSLSNHLLLSKLSTIESNLIDIEDNYDQKVIQLTELNKCDVCLGNSLCKFINNLLINNTPYVKNGKVYRKAVMKNTNEKITLMSPTNDKWTQLEEMICRNASMSVPCDQSLAIQNSFMSKSDLFITNDNYRDFFGQIHRTYYANDEQNPFLQPIFSQCATDKYLHLMTTSFDDNNDKYLDLSEQSHLLSSLIAFPGYSILKIMQKLESDLQFANLKGVCGRLLAFDGDYQTLEEFIKEQNSFEVMAGLAVQLIQLIDDLQEEDPNWYLLKTKLTYDSILVNKDGEIFLSDLDDMVIIDKSLFDEQSLRSHPSLLNSEVCNENCFTKFHQRFLKASNTTSSLPSLECGYIQKYYGQHMYAMVCRNIFSNIGSTVDTEVKSDSSLLRLVPNKDKENVEDLIRECIYETSPGGRKQAIDELRDLLKSYLHFEDNNEENNQENNENTNEDDEDNDINDNDINDNNNENSNDNKKLT